METGLPMLAAYSAYMYGKVPDKEKMEQVMKGLFGVSWDDFCLLDIKSQLGFSLSLAVNRVYLQIVV